MKNTILVLLATLSICAFAGHDRTVEKTFAVNDNVRFALDSHKGHISLRSHAANEVQIKAHIYMEDEARAEQGNDLSNKLIDGVELQIEAKEAMVHVEVKHMDSSLFENLFKKNQSRTLPLVDFEIFVPANASINLTTHKGTMDIDAPSGRIEIDTHKGTGNIRNIRNDLNVSTHKGQFTLDIAELADVDISTHKGQITCNVAGASNFEIEAATNKGSLNFNGRDITVEHGEKKGSWANHVEGTGKNHIDLATHKGEITVNFQ